MTGSAKIGAKPLSQLCDRLSTSVSSGIDIRRIWTSEADRGNANQRQVAQHISKCVSAGESLTDAIKKTGDYFPTLFREMVEVGEQTAKLDEVFSRLSDHYQHQIKLRRAFLAGIAWPLINLAMGIAAIGLFIWIVGIVSSGDSEMSVLGFGSGTSGLINYLMFLSGIGCVVCLLVYGLRSGWFSIDPIRQLLIRVPVLGNALQTLALSRMAWCLALTSDTAMDVRKSLSLAQRSTQNPFYTQHISTVDGVIMNGGEIHTALRRTFIYPEDFLDTLEVGEESGRMSESMTKLSKIYQDKARAALGVLTMFAGFVVWGLIGALFVFLIFNLFTTFYLGPINDALNM